MFAGGTKGWGGWVLGVWQRWRNRHPKRVGFWGVRGGSKGVKKGVKKTMAGLLNNVFFGKNLHVWQDRRLDRGITNPVPSGRNANGGQNPVRSQNRFTIPYYLLCAASVVVDFWGPFWQIPRASVKNDPFWTFLDPFWTLAPKPDSDPPKMTIFDPPKSQIVTFAPKPNSDHPKVWHKRKNWLLPKVKPWRKLKTWPRSIGFRL